jgi:hypothetical protein
MEDLQRQQAEEQARLLRDKLDRRRNKNKKLTDKTDVLEEKKSQIELEL